MRLASVVVAASFVLAAGRAHADAKADATVLLDEGVTLLKAGKYADALDRFERAYETYPSPKIFANLASSLKGLGRNAEAANFEQRYLDEADPDADKRKKAEKTLSELDAKLGFVTITVEPADGAEVNLGDGRWWPVTTLARWRVTPGDFVVEARRPGSKTAASRGKVARGATEAVAFTLEPEGGPEPVPEPVPVPVSVPEQPVVRATTPAKRGRLGGYVRALFDGKGRGVAGTVGALIGLGDQVAIEAAAILGGTLGGYLGAGVDLTGGTVRPRLAAGVPIYVSDGARFALRGAAGVEWLVSSRLSLVVELGVEYVLEPEMDIEPVVFAPSIGCQGWL